MTLRESVALFTLYFPESGHRKGLTYPEARMAGDAYGLAYQILSPKGVVVYDSECPTCAGRLSGYGPGHAGSPTCESGAIAAGGTRAHCSCDVCF